MLVNPDRCLTGKTVEIDYWGGLYQVVGKIYPGLIERHHGGRQYAMHLLDVLWRPATHIKVYRPPALQDFYSHGPTQLPKLRIAFILRVGHLRWEIFGHEPFAQSIDYLGPVHQKLLLSPCHKTSSPGREARVECQLHISQLGPNPESHSQALPRAIVHIERTKLGARATSGNHSCLTAERHHLSCPSTQPYRPYNLPLSWMLAIRGQEVSNHDPFD